MPPPGTGRCISVRAADCDSFDNDNGDSETAAFGCHDDSRIRSQHNHHIAIMTRRRSRSKRASRQRLASMLARPTTLLSLALLLASCMAPATAMRADRVAELRQDTAKMFYHGFDGYMQIAFPEDELRPVSCLPLTRDNKNPHNVELNDVLGNYSLTLIDSLSTLAILASAPPEDGDAGPRSLREFQDGVASLVQLYGDGRPGPSGQGQRGRGFDQDSKVQVFETVIRGVGGLLSAHQFAVGDLPINGYNPPDPDQPSKPNIWPSGFVYDGQLLRLAHDLASRMLPAFYSATGMPYPRVNLRYGIPFYANSPLHGPNMDDVDGSSSAASGEVTETCSAGAGSLVLEFSVLSRLTGDQRFEQLAKRAFWAVWYRRSDIGLIGAGVDAEQGRWIGAHSVIGAGADSFFEYALKSHILLSGHELPNRTYEQPPLAATGKGGSTGGTGVSDWLDPNAMFPRLSDDENRPESFLTAWHLAHAAIKRHLYSDREHPHYVNVNLWTGSLASQWIDSLGAYYSGLLVLAGELEEAIETNLLYTAVWTKYAALPERWSLKDRTVEGGLGWWPLRPEFIESVYHIYRATHDPWYLYVGEMVLRDINRRCWTRCGWAGLQNVLDGEKTDRMESFFLGETAKYMYLLFDDQHPLNSLDAAYVFTTEGHPLIIPTQYHRRRTKLPKRSSSKKSSSQATQQQAKQPSKEMSPDQESATAGDPGRSTAENFATQDVGLYDNNGFARACPAPSKPDLFTGSAITARTDIFHASKMLDLHISPGTPSRKAGGKYNPRQVATAYLPPRLSNHTFYPWTLPPSMLPEDGVCAKIQLPLEMSLEFSAAQQDSFGGRNTAFGSFGTLGGGITALSRASSNKIRVHSISGLKLVFRLDDENDERTWRVTRINGVPMGRDESVVIDRGLLSHISDPRFNLVRDPIVVKLHHMHKIVMMAEEQDEEEGTETTDSSVAVSGNGTVESATDGPVRVAGYSDNASGAHPATASAGSSAAGHSSGASDATDATDGNSGFGTLVRSLWQQILSSLDDTLPRATSTPGRYSSGAGDPLVPLVGTADDPLNLVLNITGVTPTGLGAASLPSVDTPPGSTIPASGAVPKEILPWMSVYAGGYGCDAPFPDAAVREHQVFVIRRGGCSFSQKLANVPPFPPGRPQSLQLVVIVSDNDDIGTGSHTHGDGNSMTFYDDASDFVRPLLDETQRTPSGMARRQPLAMIMVGGGQEAYEQIASADQLGLTRRYAVESQGVRIRNILIDDGDEITQ